MNFVNYCPIVPEEKPEPTNPGITQWSLGIAMFAAFVVPFLLLFSSARYRMFVALAKHKIEAVSQAPFNSLYGGKPHLEKPSHDQKSQ